MKKAVAKVTFIRSTEGWRVYWMRSDMKWHGYAPMPSVESIEEFFRVSAADEFQCFFG